jgi:hypothetical protein
MGSVGIDFMVIDGEMRMLAHGHADLPHDVKTSKGSSENGKLYL